MTVFLTPEQEPFFAGTYFPPVDRFGRPGFRTVLQKLSELWQSDRGALVEQAKQLTAHVRQVSGPGESGALSLASQQGAVLQLAQSYDRRYGGFGKAPKFPPAQSLELLLRYVRRTKDQAALEMLRGTLDGMKAGGMYDQLGGGFARYSTDERWHVPHFEKMLYDNAQLAKVYSEAFQLTREPEYARIAQETLDYVQREMQGPEGGYYSATDADSEGVEGKFFVWEPHEIEERKMPRAFAPTTTSRRKGTGRGSTCCASSARAKRSRKTWASLSMSWTLRCHARRRFCIGRAASASRRCSTTKCWWRGTA
jgi:uncharacterized protein YyaL (SSP411 family)